MYLATLVIKNQLINGVRNMKKTFFNVVYAAFLLSFPMLSFAQAGGGLDAGTTALDGFRVWAYGFLAVVVVVYMLYKVMMALLQKETWGDVAQGLGYCAIAGGIMVAADFMWSIWGSGSAI